jgi:hypothetical protein
MSSRQEEKQRRREEREAAEKAAQSAASRRRRLQLVGGGALVAAAIAAVVIALASGGDDSKEAPTASVPIPARQISDLDAAAKAAGCVVKSFPSEGREHLASDSATFDGYRTNPATSGTHRPTPAEDGIYTTGNEPAKENWVHSLEHGRILLQYAPGTPAQRVAQLQTLAAEPLNGVSGYHQLVFQNNTRMPFAVAGVAWTHYVGCERFTDKTFDVLRAFRQRYVDKGPELIP